MEVLEQFRPTEIMIVDFSYPMDDTLKLWGLGAKLTIIDHHKTAEAGLRTISETLLVNIIFDTTKAGCTLAWEHFCPQFAVPEILRYVADRDLWQFELSYSKEVNAYIATLQEDFETWAQFDLNEAIPAGEAIVAFANSQMERRLRDVKMVGYHPVNIWPIKLHPEVGDFLIPYVNATDNISELGNLMCERYPDAPFSMSYCDRGDGMRSYSLRSIGDFDVSVVAKAFGGGGHKNAAGFALPKPQVI